jgi:hypothetical protein
VAPARAGRLNKASVQPNAVPLAGLRVLDFSRALVNPIRMGTMPGRSVRSHPSALGQDSHEVLRDCGLPASRIDALISNRVPQCA